MRPLSAAPAAVSAAVARSVRRAATEAARAPAVILPSAERREIFVFMVFLTRVELWRQYTPGASPGVKQECAGTGGALNGRQNSSPGMGSRGYGSAVFCGCDTTENTFAGVDY